LSLGLTVERSSYVNVQMAQATSNHGMMSTAAASTKAKYGFLGSGTPLL
jgi:hypothetical protein